MLEFLPTRIADAIRHVNLRFLYEIRLRTNKALLINFGGQYRWLSENGMVDSEKQALIPTGEEVEEALFAASGYSVYSVENQIRQGFVTTNAGERIGIAGSYVYENGKPLSIRNVTSLCIRIPHPVEGCAEEIYARCLKDKIRSFILLSRPGLGKTTLLRDVSRLVSQRTGRNILVSDERGELSAGDLGQTSDVVKFSDKLTAFTAGIRAMRPDIIVTDELLDEDYPAVRRAVRSGITVFASAHLTRTQDVPKGLFERYVTLNALGTVEAIYGEDGSHVD